MHRTRFHDARLIHTAGWPVFFALGSALAIVIYVLIRMAE
jgi:hypothetical protein